MPLDLMALPAPEAEALAYAEGFTGTARLFARVADMQKALGEAVAEIETLKQENQILRDELTVARHERAYLGGID
jgi:regulator of replication initiation timing